MYSRKFLRLEHEPLSDLSFDVDLTMRRLPDFGIASVRISPLRVGRTRELISDGNDGLTFQLSSTAGLARQLGREIEVEAGQAVAMSNADVGAFDFPSTSRVLALSLSRGRLAALVRNLEDTLVRAVPNDNQAVALLKGYIGALDDLAASAAPELAEMVVAHLYDLAALALGAVGDAAAMARGPACGRKGFRAPPPASFRFARRQRGRAPRGHAALRAHAVRAGRPIVPGIRSCGAARPRVPRAVGDATRSVSAVAFATGFGDLSHFNRTFRRQFGCTPTELRADARRDSL
jgi:AraC-like DNA-binding protein